MLLVILILVFGLLFGIRIYFLNKQNRIFDDRVLKNTLVVIGLLSFLICLSVRDRGLLVWTTISCSILCVRATVFITGFIREIRFRRDFIEFLDRVILYLRSGNGFAYSLDLSNQKTSQLSQTKLQKLIEAVQFEQKIETAHDFVREIYEEFIAVQNFPHKTVERLCAFRRKIRIEESFRRKSGRIVRQIRIQVTFLGIMYIGVLSFVVSRFGFKQNFSIVLWSLGLFILGVYMFFYLGTRKLWKI